MAQEDVRMFPNIVTPGNPVIFNEKVCNVSNTLGVYYEYP